jgi:hypothetical protein
VKWILDGVERNVFIAWSISHRVTCLICLWFFFTKWPALFLSLFLYPFGIKSNQIVPFRMGEKAYIDRLGSNAQLGVPSGSLLSQLVHGMGWGGAGRGGAGWGWGHHHIVSKVQSLKLENHHIMFECFW